MSRFFSSAVNLLLVLVLGVSLSGCVSTRLPTATSSPWQSQDLDTQANPLDIAFTDPKHGLGLAPTRSIVGTGNDPAHA